MALMSKSMQGLRADIPTDLLKDQPEQVKVNVRVPLEMRTAWKFAALQRGVSLNELMIEAMKAYSSPVPDGPFKPSNHGKQDRSNQMQLGIGE